LSALLLHAQLLVQLLQVLQLAPLLLLLRVHLHPSLSLTPIASS
jgi:hypothetical protein